MRRLTAAEVHAQKVTELGLDPAALDLKSVEAISGALRRAASILCPCAGPTLVRNVVRPLRGLIDDLDAAKESVEETLEALVSHGDLLEQHDLAEDGSPQSRILLYAAPPSFVSRRSGGAIVLGVTSDKLSPLPDELEDRIEYLSHVRRLNPLTGDDLRAELLQLGLIELSYERWLKAPPFELPVDHVTHVDQLLDETLSSRDVPGLLLLDPELPVRYYRGRWVEPRSRSGRFVARRKQSYGADLWSYVQLRDGQPERLIDLPLVGSRWRGCDEAWRLQMAIDYRRGEPQRYRVRQDPGGSMVLELFSPVPAWARRRWDAVGEPVLSSGCLFAYRFSPSESGEEMAFVRDTMWLQELSRSPRS